MTDRAPRDFPEFVAARGGALQRAAYLMVGDTGLAQDLVQEALVKTYVAWPRLRETGHAEAYTRDRPRRRGRCGHRPLGSTPGAAPSAKGGRRAALLEDQADAARLANIDLAAVLGVGRRRVRRRRGRSGRHAGAVVVAGSVVRLVSTRVGYVFTDGQQQVWSVHDGTVSRVGTSGGPLVSDPDGTLAGWADGSARRLSFVVLDQQTGQVTATPGRSSSASVAPGEYVDGSMIAVDGDTVYWRDGDDIVQQVLTATVATGTVPLARDQTLLTVGHGLAVETNDQTGEVTVGPLGTADPVTLPGATDAGATEVSPDGRWVALGVPQGQGAPEVYDTSSGARVPLDVTGQRTFPFAWLGAETVAVLSARTLDSEYQVLACSIRTGRCTVADADLGETPDTGGNGSGFALPTGDFYFPFLHG